MASRTTSPVSFVHYVLVFYHMSLTYKIHLAPVQPTNTAAFVPVPHSGPRLRYNDMPNSRYSSNRRQRRVYKLRWLALTTKRLAVLVFAMKGLRLKNRFSRCAKDRPPSLGPVDFEIRALSGGTTSTLLFHELPPKGATTHQNRIAELHEEIRCLSNEVAYYKALTDEALSRILPVV